MALESANRDMKNAAQLVANHHGVPKRTLGIQVEKSVVSRKFRYEDVAPRTVLRYKDVHPALLDFVSAFFGDRFYSSYSRHTVPISKGKLTSGTVFSIGVDNRRLVIVHVAEFEHSSTYMCIIRFHLDISRVLTVI